MFDLNSIKYLLIPVGNLQNKLYFLCHTSLMSNNLLLYPELHEFMLK